MSMALSKHSAVWGKGQSFISFKVALYYVNDLNTTYCCFEVENSNSSTHFSTFLHTFGTEEQNRFKRWVEEAIEIRKRKGAFMNRDEGQYFLSHVYD